MIAAALAAALAWGAPAWSSAARAAVDPRTELLTAVHMLADGEGLRGREPGPRFRADSSAYADALKAWFSPYAGEPAVASLRALQPVGLDAVTALAFVIQTFDRAALTFEPGRLPVYFGDAFHSGRPEQRAALVRFGEELTAFARASRFREFFGSQRPFYERYESAVRRGLGKRDYLGEFARYNGEAVSAEITLHVVPLFHDFGSSIYHRDGKTMISGYFGPEEVLNGRPVFRYAGVERKIWQELGHVALDSLPAKFPEDVAASKSLFDWLPGVGRCEEWTNCVRQYSARAVGYRLHDLHRRSNASAQELATAVRDLDPVTAAAADALHRYEADREKYPRLRDFYPQILDAFTQLAKTRR